MYEEQLELNGIYDNQNYPIANLSEGTIIQFIDFKNDVNFYSEFIGDYAICVKISGYSQVFLILIRTGSDWHNENLMNETVIYKIIKHPG